MPLTPTLSPLVPRGEREKISAGCVKMRSPEKLCRKKLLMRLADSIVSGVGIAEFARRSEKTVPHGCKDRHEILSSFQSHGLSSCCEISLLETECQMNLKMRRANTAIQCRSALDSVVPRDLASPMKAHTRKNAISGRGVSVRTKGGGGWVKSSSNRKSRSCRALDRRQSFLSGLRRLAQAQSLKAQRPSDGRKNRATNRDPLANHGAVPKVAP